MRNKLSIFLGIGIVVAVIATMGFYLMNAGSLDLFEIVIIPLVLVLAIVAAWVALKRGKEIKAGFNPDDELSKMAGWKAGYHAYLASIWVAVGMMWLNIFLTETFNTPEFTPGIFIGAIVILPGLVFLGLAIYFKGKGNVE